MKALPYPTLIHTGVLLYKTLMGLLYKIITKPLGLFLDWLFRCEKVGLTLSTLLFDFFTHPVVFWGVLIWAMWKNNDMPPKPPKNKKNKVEPPSIFDFY